LTGKFDRPQQVARRKMARSSHAYSLRALGLAIAAYVWLLCGTGVIVHHAFASLARRACNPAIARAALFEGEASLENVKETLSDPTKQEEMSKMYADIMSDPEKAKAMEEYDKQMKERVAKLRADPEMKEFFEDIDKNGMEAIQNWENNEAVLLKFSEAMGGVPGAGGAVPAGNVFKPGQEVIIKDLSKKPELNGKKAMVVPPTPEEQKTLEGTGRIIVRLTDSGDQFAVMPNNLQSTSLAANAAMGSGLEDISLQDPAVQAEAAKLRESGVLDALQNDPELKPVFEDIKKNGMGALEKYWNDEKMMAKISKAMGA